MEHDVAALFDESVRLELIVSDAYHLFWRLFPGDADFWWRLALEEMNHAALLRSGKELFQPADCFPRHLLCPCLDELRQTSGDLLELMQQFKITPPSRLEALNIAFELEKSVSEQHFQQFMEGEANSSIAKVFQQLNKDDKDHAQRISSYLKQRSLSVNSFT